MIDFIKKWVLFRINPKEKELYRDRVMKNDHQTYRLLLIVIMIIQAFMLVSSFITGGDSSTYKVCYRFLYGALVLICFVCLILTEALFKRGKKFHYFMVVSLTMFMFMLWGAGISLIDSREHTNLTYFAIALIASSAFITLEPWVAILTTCVSTIVFDTTFAVLSKYVDSFLPQVGFGFFITTTTVVGIAWVGSTFNFHKRINAIKLELEVSNLNDSLKDKAFYDDLTKIHNRRYLTENIDNPLNYNEPYSGIILFDIDKFKAINDTYGHQVGDLCLELVGKELNLLIKDKDAYAVRYGGDEFLVYFHKITPEQLKEESLKLKNTINKAKISVPGGNKISLKISSGLALAKDGISYNDLINEADKALYEEKHK